MNPSRKRFALSDGFPIAYSDEVTEDQVRQIDELVKEEFEDEGWVTVEQEA